MNSMACGSSDSSGFGLRDGRPSVRQKPSQTAVVKSARTRATMGSSCSGLLMFLSVRSALLGEMRRKLANWQGAMCAAAFADAPPVICGDIREPTPARRDGLG